ncbi:MAG: ABC transporter substrate-binding protein [Anaerovoracaceae bacterium]
MRKYKKLSIVISIMLIMAMLSGCSTLDNFREAFFNEKGAASETIQIGVLEPQTGGDSEKGKLEIMGIELAHELYPVVLGKKVELIYADTQSSLYVTETAVQDLLTKKPAVVLGTYGEACALQASQYIKASKTPAITISTTNPLITVNNPYYFRVCFLESSQGAALAEYAVKGLKAKKCAILRAENDDASISVAKKFQSAIKSLTKDENYISYNQEVPSVDADYTDYAGYLVDAKISGANAIFMPISSPKTVEEIFKRANEMAMYDVTFLGTKDWHSEKFLKIIMKYPRLKVAITSDFSKNSTTTKTAELFIEEYTKKYGKDQAPAVETALAFDAYLLATGAIAKVGSVDSELVRSSLATTKKFQGASGEISFSPIGDPYKTINIDEVRGKNFVSIYTVN